MPHKLPAALLTGARGIGKTTLCLEIVNSETGFAGLLSPPLFNDSGEKCGFSGRCIGSEFSWEFGRVDRDLYGPRIGKYSLSRTGIERAILCVKLSLNQLEKITIIDEIGPLELRKGEGLAPLLPCLAAAGPLLLVIRKEMISYLMPYIPFHTSRVFHVGERNRDTITGEIISYLKDPSENEDTPPTS
ncbi:MAG: hypothetical protein HN368_05600 [Spirochaetales bacterium]|jgi:nucleoside-triphosphatase THEP1|nr:hypothetical protein [Spirochaetales bacterium]